jgi:hypothetical protein
MSGNFDRLVLETEIRQLEKQLARYERHKVSLENQRARIQERVELTKRDPTRAVMYADFVSWFARNGDKIKDLVFVLIRGGRHLRIHNIHWGAGAGCDSYFVVDVVVHILRNTTFLDNILSLDMVSDNGPCFASRRLWYFMSKAFGLSIQWRPHRPGGLRVENLFLTEYHGQSVADGTGMCAAGFYNRVSLENQSTGYPRDGAELCQGLNSDAMRKHNKKTHTQTVAYNYKVVNYGVDVFLACDGPAGAGKNLNYVTGLQSTAGCVAYCWQQDGAETRLEGVVCVREFTGVGPWQFADILH